MFGVFDGHGAVGHTVSQFVKKKWPETMDRALMNGKKRKRKEKEKTCVALQTRRVTWVEDVHVRLHVRSKYAQICTNIHLLSS